MIQLACSSHMNEYSFRHYSYATGSPPRSIVFSVRDHKFLITIDQFINIRDPACKKSNLVTNN